MQTVPEIALKGKIWYRNVILFPLRNFAWSVTRSLIQDDASFAIQGLGTLYLKDFKKQVSVESFFPSPRPHQNLGIKLNWNHHIWNINEEEKEGNVVLLH